MSPTQVRNDRGVVLSQVSKAFGDEFASKLVVRECSFTIRDGEFTVMIGPSG